LIELVLPETAKDRFAMDFKLSSRISEFSVEDPEICFPPRLVIEADPGLLLDPLGVDKALLISPGFPAFLLMLKIS